MGPSQRPLPDTRQASMPTLGISIRNPSNREAADPCLTPRGHWDRHILTLAIYIIQFITTSWQSGTIQLLEKDCVPLSYVSSKVYEFMLAFFGKSAISIKLLFFRSKWKTFLGEGGMSLKTDPSHPETQNSSADAPIGWLSQCPWGLF